MFNLSLKPHFKKKIIILQKGIIVASLWLASCSDPEQSERDRLRQKNAKGEYVYRHHDEFLYPIPELQPRQRDIYPWEKESTSHMP
jgi:hypothetical protein